MASDKTAVRFPWVALVLSFLASGVGHIYCGRIARGLLLYAARFLLPLLCILTAFMAPSNTLFVGLILVPAVATVVIFFYSAIDAWVIAKRTDPEFELKEYNRSSLYWLLVTVQLACLIVLTMGVRAYAYEAFLIPTRSMSPGFLSGDRILVNKRPLRDGFPERGDVIVFRTPSSEPGRTWIKRVIGVAGDEIVIRGREVEVNGTKLERERLPPESSAGMSGQVHGDVYYESHAGRRYRILFDDDSFDEASTDEIRVTVPDRSVFVLGDNRDRSRDSRHIGSIHAGDVIGYVDYIYFPAESWSRFGLFRD